MFVAISRRRGNEEAFCSHTQLVLSVYIAVCASLPRKTLKRRRKFIFSSAFSDQRSPGTAGCKSVFEVPAEHGIECLQATVTSSSQCPLQTLQTCRTQGAPRSAPRGRGQALMTWATATHPHTPHPHPPPPPPPPPLPS